MALIQVKVIEGVFTAQQKQEILERLTETMVDIEGENLRSATVAVLEEVRSGDWGRTPHGAIIAGAAFGKLPFVMKGIQLEAVGIDDAARAMLSPVKTHGVSACSWWGALGRA